MELVGGAFHAFVDDGEHLGQGQLLLLGELFGGDALEELLGDADERLVGPTVEPVERAAVDQGGEHASPIAQQVTHGRHAQDNVELVSERLDEVLLDVFFVDGDFLLVEKRLKMETHIILVLFVVQVCDLARIQYIVNVFQEALIHDLRVVQNECRRLLLAPRV